MKELAFGIDFGTTNSLVSIWGGNVQAVEGSHKPRPIWDTSSGANHPHPSVVWYRNDGDPIVGLLARQNMASHQNAMGHRFVRSVKRLLGADREVETLGGQREPAWETASRIFQHLSASVSAYSGLKRPLQMKEAVVTIPVHFNGRQRRDIRRAMERAGIRLQTFIHEPFAALISHFYEQDRKLDALRGQRVVVFDWGGGTLDVCLVEVSKDGKHIYEVAHDGIEDRAGDDFDRNLMRHVKSRFTEANGLPPDFEPRGSVPDRFWAATEDAKIELSRDTRVRISVPSFHQIENRLLDLSQTVERSEFESIILPELEAAESCIKRLLHKGRITPGLVDHVLLVGGTSNIPAVRHMMEQLFGAKVSVAKEPEAAISRGAAIVAAEGWQPYNVKDIGVKLSDDSFFTILPADTPLIPQESKGFTFICTDPRAGTADFFFHERHVIGDGAFLPLNVHLSVPTDSSIRKFDAMDRVIANFVITEDATLKCVAQSSSAGKEREIEITDIGIGLQLK